MESKFKKILLQSTVFTCLSSGVTVTMALDADRETTASKEYHTHHAANFISITEKNPAMAAIKKQQLEHRATIKADVTLMLNEIKKSLAQSDPDFNLLINIITAALTADADAINDIEDKHEAKKTATVPDTAATLKTKADEYNTEKGKDSISATIQHYRLAYFLMLKLQPWLEKEYKNDPSEADTVLKDEIPTHYPEWTDKKILIKGLKVNLDNVAKSDTAEHKVKFSTAKTTVPTGTKLYRYDGKGNSGTEVPAKNYKITLSSNGSEATISGLTDYGLYYMEIDGVTYYFSVNSTKQDELIYMPDGIVKFTTSINKGLRTAAEENSSFRPKLSLKRNGTPLHTDTFKVRLSGETTWQKLDYFETNDFLRSDHKLEFSGLNAGAYTFEAAASDEVVVTPLASDGDDKLMGGNTLSTTENENFTILKSIVTFTATAVDKIYDETTTAEISDWSAEANNKNTFSKSSTSNFSSAVVLTGRFKTAAVGTNKPVDVTVALNSDTVANNYLSPPFTTTATINPAQGGGTPAGVPGGGTTGGGTTPKLKFIKIDSFFTSHNYLGAAGTVENIAAGDYIVSMHSTSNQNRTGTIVVASDGTFYVSLDGLTFSSGESVTVTITAGAYQGTTFNLTIPTITSDFGDANAAIGSGTVTFTGLGAFNGITPTVVAALGNAVTGYTGVTAIAANGTFTATYATSAAPGSITPEGTININGTNFTFTGSATVN